MIFLHKLGSKPITAQGLVAGLSTTAAILFLGWTTVAVDAQRDLARQTQAIPAYWTKILTDGEHLLKELNSLSHADCNKVHLTHLGELTFKNDFINNIWFFGENETQAKCSSAFGIWKTPADLGIPNVPDVYKRGNATWLRVPFDKIEGIDTVTVSKTGRYGLSYISPSSPIDADKSQYYLTAADDPTKPLYSFALDGELYKEYQASLGPIFGPIYANACAPYVGNFCFLTMKSSQKVISENIYLFALIFGISLIAGWIACDFVDQATRKRKTAFGRIQKALRRGGAGFHCHYQPILSLDNMTADGCEVLARYEDTYGAIYPDQFIKIVQQLDCTWLFTEIIIQKALTDLEPLMKTYPGFRVSINFFQSDLEDCKLDAIRNSQALENFLQAGGNLCCEILETGIRPDASTIKSLAYLRSVGCQIAIDDFGTGFSNLAQIKELKPDLIKIDKMFVDEIRPNMDVSRSAFLQAILDIAHAHDLKVCAEGVETMEQLASLRQTAVDYGQGYLFAKPGPIEALGKYLSAKKTVPTALADEELSGFLMAEKETA